MICKNPLGIFLYCINIVFAINQYPAWFLNPDTTSEVIVGYTYGKASSLVDAKQTYCTYKNCIIDGVVYRYNNYDQRVNDYYYTFNQNCYDSLENQLVPLSSFATNLLLGQSIALYALTPGVTVNNEIINPQEIPEPRWVKRTFWEDTNAYYSVGSYSSKRNENDAWKSAEEKGLFELMNSIVVTYFGVKISTATEDGIRSETAEALQLKFHLKNIQIINRWPDIQQNQFYVLVKIPKKDVYSPFMKINKRGIK